MSKLAICVLRFSTMRNKTDRNDARGIAQMMRLGWYRAVHVKNIDMQKMRSLQANRKLLERKLIDIEITFVARGERWLANGSRWSRGLRSTRPGAPRA